MTFPRIAIVGAGRLSTNRIYPYIGAAGAQLVGVCDKDLSKAKKNAKLFGGIAYDEMEKMIKKEKPDGVIICIGPDAHARLAPIVMRYGIPVYTEKPPAANAADALAVAKISKETGILCTTAFKKRYNKAYSRAKEYIGQFPFEDLFSISIDYASAQYFNDSSMSCFLLDFAIHMIDLSVYLFGDAKEVFAFSKGLDAYTVSVKYFNGAVGSFNFNDARSFTIPTEEVEISIKGGNFMSIHNSSSWKICNNGKAIEWREPPIFTSLGDNGYEKGHLAEIVDFINAIQEKRSTRSCIYESYKTMVLYEAILESSKTGKVVQPKYEVLL